MGQTASAFETGPELTDPQGLKSAFEMFNQMSAQLADSYDALQTRVNQLNQELSAVSAERYRELAKKEELANRLETLLNVLPGGVIVLDAKGRVTQANPASREMLSEPLINCSWRQIIERNFAPKADDGHEVSTLDGRRYSIATRSLDDDGQIILLTDQTETRHLQAQLSRHERLSSMGKMVAALAHQIRTPLSAALLYCGHLEQAATEPERTAACAKKIYGRLMHMERQVKDMLFFVRGDLPVEDVLLLGEFKNQLAEALDASFSRAGVQCQWRIEKADQTIRVNKDALIGAIQNLVDNAIQAAGGALNLAIVMEPFVNNALAISVVDNGPGLPEAIADSVCDLFVTSKPQGTGLGLAVVQQVAKAHGGKFVIRSMAGKGTRATLLIPVFTGRTSAQPLEKSA
ncbi:ATP-binding protein [Simiduia sp. 21SJ11W-1]|uniref:sensor histidine kinase n=1 Tax=Simiduia sp. 21SJ11W-1 TaxID=2909669 RepID=UPI0020A22E31|nr:ATP-binding protein [Simiduia sp. 21SJ11W-1]UTA49480.1 ATP-binding protein [Simiduia sp. 21SJ11W-1]